MSDSVTLSWTTLEILLGLAVLLGVSFHLGGALWYTKRQRLRIWTDVNAAIQGAVARLEGILDLKVSDVRAEFSRTTGVLSEKVASLKADLPRVPSTEDISEDLRARMGDLPTLGTVRAEIQASQSVIAGQLKAQMDVALSEMKQSISGMMGGLMKGQNALLRYIYGGEGGDENGELPTGSNELAAIGKLFGVDPKSSQALGMLARRLKRHRNRGREPAYSPQESRSAPPSSAPAPSGGPRQLSPAMIEELRRAGFIHSSDLGAATNAHPDEIGEGPSGVEGQGAGVRGVPLGDTPRAEGDRGRVPAPAP